MRISWEIRSMSRDWLLYVSTMSRDFMKFIQARDDSQLLEEIPWLSCSFRITSTRSRRIEVCVHTLSVTPCYIKHKSHYYSLYRPKMLLTTRTNSLTFYVVSLYTATFWNETPLNKDLLYQISLAQNSYCK
jgi:hypothetical protein